MAKKDPQAEQLGAAWASINGGLPKAAVEGFEGILRSDTQHIDALFGLALAYKVAGERASARQHFERCLSLVQAARQAEPRSDRYMMLERIIQQRMRELSAG